MNLIYIIKEWIETKEWKENIEIIGIFIDKKLDFGVYKIKTDIARILDDRIYIAFSPIKNMRGKSILASDPEFFEKLETYIKESITYKYPEASTVYDLYD